MLTYDLTERAGAPLYRIPVPLPEAGYPLRQARRGRAASGPAELCRASGRLARHGRRGVQPAGGRGLRRGEAAKGYFVAVLALPDAAAEPSPTPDRPEPERRWRLDLRSNRVDASLFPVGTWARLTRRVLSEDPEALPAQRAAPGALRAARGDSGLSARL